MSPDPYRYGDDALAGELLEGDDIVDPPPTPARKFRKGLGKVFMVAGGVMGLFVVVYAADLMISAGDVPRGVTVAGVDVGGMNRADAEATLRKELDSRLTQPVQVRAGDVEAKLAPKESGLGVDWAATVEQAGTQPLSPITRITSFFTTREVGVETKSDSQTLAQAVDRLAGTQLNHGPTEGGIAFVDIPGSDGGIEASAVEPRQGQQLADLDTAIETVEANWLGPSGIDIAMSITPVKASSEGVRLALEQTIRPAIAAPVTVKGEGRDAVLRPGDIGAAFLITAVDGGGLDVKVNPAKLQETLAPQLAETEKEGKDAAFEFASGAPTVVPSEQARQVSWQKTLQPYTEVLKKTDGRELPAVYDTKDPSLTTDAANALGVKEVIGEFSSSGFSGPAATNVQAAAAKVNGALVKPGETFSLNNRLVSLSSGEFTRAPVREDGTGEQVPGGGVSQFTTTLYNAAYFGGLKDAGHTAHPYYLDRYPFARDAKTLQDDGSTVDMGFTNDADTGAVIQATSSGSSVTVKIWGTKKYRVESSTGPRADVTPPPVEVGPPGCRSSAGSPGFTTSDTRVRYDIASGAEVSRETSEVTYRPRPTVICVPAPPPPTP
ncbi:vanomycin resistance protein VanB [Amycolatopsis antarctica]|uniref:Vanomycin resistance protein VanB n=2 Tax=Amycolatopsis antarctica TaxID=1854586 RepID=A0A263D5W3_9PSEU|nr:vanomycin resistance protein VanB [Amycolatopsis antarctica]